MNFFALRFGFVSLWNYAEGVSSLSLGLARGTSAYPGYKKTRPTLKGLYPKVYDAH
jgi:hypothetical protein